MPSPIKVRLVPHNPCWTALAEAEADPIRSAVGPIILGVHHIGSTAIPGIAAKPILDLLAVATSLPGLETARLPLEAIGYAWWGEYGLAGRRYCTLTSVETGDRRVQLHCYAQSNPAIDRHLAFRDYLRAHPAMAAEYEQEKARCSKLHRGDSHAYTDCKSAWIKRLEAQIL